MTTVWKYTAEVWRNRFKQFFPFSFISCSLCKKQTYYTDEHSVNACINRFSSKHASKNINLLKLHVNWINHFNTLKSCRVWLKILSWVIFTSFKRHTTDMNKVISTYTCWAIIWSQWIRHTYMLSNNEQKDTSVEIPQWSEEAEHTCKVFLLKKKKNYPAIRTEETMLSIMLCHWTFPQSSLFICSHVMQASQSLTQIRI